MKAGSNYRTFLSGLLAVVLVAGMCPTRALATQGDHDGAPSV